MAVVNWCKENLKLSIQTPVWYLYLQQSPQLYASKILADTSEGNSSGQSSWQAEALMTILSLNERCMCYLIKQGLALEVSFAGMAR
ncbi:hypothetical protein RJT34_13232 [Clitoria ternatea]|uniref:Uncharacterized protein n=1 Tax=Clitoria ternatea TaxID=43366 RepID=A0AAN9PK12_CLITE